MPATMANLLDPEETMEDYGPLRCGLCGKTDSSVYWIAFLQTAICHRCEVDVNRHELLEPRVMRAWNYSQELIDQIASTAKSTRPSGAFTLGWRVKT